MLKNWDYFVIGIFVGFALMVFGLWLNGGVLG